MTGTPKKHIFSRLLHKQVYILVGHVSFVFKIPARIGFFLSECRWCWAWGEVGNSGRGWVSLPPWAVLTITVGVLGGHRMSLCWKSKRGGLVDWLAILGWCGYILLFHLFRVAGDTPPPPEIRSRAWRSYASNPPAHPLRPSPLLEWDRPWREGTLEGSMLRSQLIWMFCSWLISPCCFPF